MVKPDGWRGTARGDFDAAMDACAAPTSVPPRSRGRAAPRPPRPALKRRYHTNPTIATQRRRLSRRRMRRYHTDPRRRDTDRDGLTDGDEIRRYHTEPAQARHRPRRPDRRRRGAPLPHESAKPRHRPRRPDRRRRGPPLPHQSAERDTDGDGYGDRPRFAQGTDPRSTPQPPGFPGEDNTGVPRRDGAVAVHRSVDDLDAEHGDRREDDGMRRGDGARGRDP